MEAGSGPRLSRRDVLLAAGALVIASTTADVVPASAQSSAAVKLLPAPEQLDSWVALLPDGTAEAFFGKMDMGQGLETAIAQIVADELDLAVEQVIVRMGDTALTCNQGGASGSTGVSLGAKPLRNAAAEARRILLERAATVLGVPASKLSVIRGVITADDPSARSVTYAQLIGGKHFDATLEWNKAVGNFMDVKGQAQPKSPAAYRLVGKSVPRRDVAGKIFGTADYVTDIRVPGMLHARMIRPPQGGSTIASVAIPNSCMARSAPTAPVTPSTLRTGVLVAKLRLGSLTDHVASANVAVPAPAISSRPPSSRSRRRTLSWKSSGRNGPP